MKKTITHIIDQLFSFLFGLLFPGKTKNSDKIGARKGVAVMTALVPVEHFFIKSCYASGEKTLWRQTIFRCGSSAIIYL